MEPELDFNNYRIKNDYYNNQIADVLELLNFHLEIIAKKFSDYKYSKEKEDLMSNIGSHFSLITTQLKIIIDDLKK